MHESAIQCMRLWAGFMCALWLLGFHAHYSLVSIDLVPDFHSQTARFFVRRPLPILGVVFLVGKGRWTKAHSYLGTEVF